MTTRTLLRTALLVAACSVLAGPEPAQAQDEVPFDERGGNAFFRDPDSKTRRRIETLIQRFASDGVLHRWEARYALEKIGFWCVEPLVEAVGEGEPQVKCASILTLEAIRDVRAIEPLRKTIDENAGRTYVPGFAALALGRFRDAGSLGVFRKALDSSSSLHTLRAAVPMALARIQTRAARDQLERQLKAAKEKKPARMAQLLSLGFYPVVALDQDDRTKPGPLLEKGLASDDDDKRAAALLGYLVATVHRRDTQKFLETYLEKQDDDAVIRVALLGLSRHGNESVARRLASIGADRRASTPVRETAVDLLIGRGDVAAKDDLIRVIKSSGGNRLRAGAVLALAAIPDATCVNVVLSRLEDNSALVRATAALGATRFHEATAREEALQVLDRRLRSVGDKSKTVRRILGVARDVLSGRRSNVDWSQVLDHPLFRRATEEYEDRLLAHVNQMAEVCLDLRKITNLGSDTQLVLVGPPGDRGAAPQGGADAEPDEPESDDMPDPEDDTLNDPVRSGPRHCGQSAAA